MSDGGLILDVPEAVDAGAVETALGDGARCLREAPERVSFAYLDTFDWRLHAAGAVLESISAGGERRLRLRTLGEGRIRLDQRVDAPPRFPGELSPGELRRWLAKRVEMRALLEAVRVRMRRTVLRVLDASDKTVVRVELWEGMARRTGRWLQIVPVRGYDKALRRVRRRLERRLGCHAACRDPMLALTASLARPPGDYRARHSVQLVPDQRADVACKRVLGELAAVMAENEEGVLGDVDSEFLHDYRVAMRRTRSLLAQVKGVFPESRIARIREGLRWLSDLTGPPRDADVYLLGFADYQAAVPRRLRPALEPLREELQIVKGESYATLAGAIRSARYRRLLDGWRRFLTAPVPGRPTSPNAGRPVVDVARERTWRMYRRVLAEGRAIDDASPAEALHELRKSCKKLRYLAECFRSLFPSAEVAEAISTLKRLQDVLGDFQDFEVQQDELGALRGRIAARGALRPATAEALDALVEELARSQHESRQAFGARFAEFDTKAHRRLYRGLYRRKGPTARA